MAEKSLHVYFSGTVQGVGFRFTAQRLARDLKIGGWAKNLYDGRVEIMAQGEEKSLEHFLEQLEENFKGCSRDIDLDWQPASDVFRNFNIRF